MAAPIDLPLDFPPEITQEELGLDLDWQKKHLFCFLYITGDEKPEIYLTFNLKKRFFILCESKILPFELNIIILQNWLKRKLSLKEFDPKEPDFSEVEKWKKDITIVSQEERDEFQRQAEILRNEPRDENIPRLGGDPVIYENEEVLLERMIQTRREQDEEINNDTFSEYGDLEPFNCREYQEEKITEAQFLEKKDEYEESIKKPLTMQDISGAQHVARYDY